METISMRTLTNTSLENISGGDVSDWISVGCGVWGGIVYFSGGTATANPAGAVLTGFCVGWAIFG